MRVDSLFLLPNENGLCVPTHNFSLFLEFHKLKKDQTKTNVRYHCIAWLKERFGRKV